MYMSVCTVGLLYGKKESQSEVRFNQKCINKEKGCEGSWIVLSSFSVELLRKNAAIK